MSIDDAKKRAALRAIDFVSDGSILGLGTGSTAEYVIRELGRRIANATMRVRGVATSATTERLAQSVGIQLVDLNDVEKVDLTIDGADQVDPELSLIKGGGGALTREKLVALASDRIVIVVDWTKIVERLGHSFPVPVEVLPFGWRRSARALGELGCDPRIRLDGSSPLRTDNGNYVIDCQFDPIEEPRPLARRIKLISGVVECGLFVDIAQTVIVGYEDRVEVRERSW